MKSFTRHSRYRRFGVSLSPLSEYKPREIRVLRVRGWSTTEAQERIWKQLAKVKSQRIYNLRRYPAIAGNRGPNFKEETP